MRRRSWMLLLVLLAIAGAPLQGEALNEIPVRAGASAATGGVFGSAGGGDHFRANVRSLWEMRYQRIVRQRHDNTCAAASVATILTHYFGFPTTEEEMVKALQVEATRDAGPDFDPRTLGYSLKHVRAVAAKGGLAAVAFKVDIRNIERIRIPVITQITLRGQPHFVVFRAARNGRIYLADPIFGNTSYRLDVFEEMWSGVMMGFMRRNAPRPTANELAYAESDDVRVEADDIWRRSRVGWLETRNVSFAGQVPIAPEIVTGTDSVLPDFIVNYREFGTALSY